MEHGAPALVSVPELYGSELLTWVLVGLLAYWVAVVALRRADLLPDYVGTQGPILTLHTTRGKDFLEWLAGPKRFWRAWSNVGIGIALVVMVAMFAFLLIAAFAVLTTPQSTSVQQPRNVLVIPGVNDFLPLSATPGIVFGLLVGLVVHEGGHGLLCRVEDIDIDSMGVAMLAILPIGAFVEPDQESSKDASRGAQTRMFAAGVTNNFAITLVAFALLFGPIAGSIAVAPGAAVGGVAPGSPAEDAGIQPNDRITAVDGEPVETNGDLTDAVAAADGDRVEVELGDDRTETVERSLLVTAAMEDGPTDLDAGDTIVAVDGDPVATQRGFEEAVGEDERVTLSVREDGDDEPTDHEVAVGVAVSLVEDGPLEGAAGSLDDPLVVTRYDGERVHDYADLDAALEGAEPGEEVSVAGYVGGERHEYEVTLDERQQSGDGFLGIEPVPGTSGLSLDDLGVQLYPAEAFLGVLGGGDDGTFGAVSDSFLGKIGLALLLPVVGVIGVLPFNFAGFTGGIQNFYEVTGALSVLGDGTVFLVANLLFWTGWINVQLGFFNCIPAFPLDGGHILRTSTESIVARLPFAATRGTVRVVTTSIGLLMLCSFLLMVFGPGLLAG